MSHAKPILLQTALALGLLVCVLFMPSTAASSPFCVTVEGVGQSLCHYEDIDECKRDAALQKGYCSANVKEFQQLPTTGSRVCLVETSRAVRCLYVDLASCQRDADRTEGVCFVRPYEMPRRAQPR